MARPAVAFVALALLALAGCAQGPAQSGTTSQQDGEERLPTITGFVPIVAADRPLFSVPLLVDEVRAGGEPVIAITPTGTILVSAHPGFTHYHPSSDPTHPGAELLQDFGGQSYLWRSTDDGATWTHIGLPGSELGPRSTAAGVSDPEFTVMEDGSICFTDLEALAAASTNCSSDDGVTWTPGNPVGSGGPVDRQWLASYGDEFYFTANYFASTADFRASTDKGITWEDRGSSPCNADVIADRRNGHLIQGCNGNGITVSTDGARTWSEVREPANSTTGGSRMMTEPAIDAAGTIWTSWTDDERTLHLAGTTDEGVTWPYQIDLTPHFNFFSGNLVTLTNSTTVDNDAATNGTYVWPWISAGSSGRVAVSWIGSYDTVSSDQFNGPWYVFTAYVLDANTASPTVVLSQLTPEPMHVGPICQGGTGCQVTSVQGDPSGDRRLGDFFETTIGADGSLYGVWSNTRERPDDVISHVQFVKQVGGVRLLTDADVGVFMPTQG